MCAVYGSAYLTTCYDLSSSSRRNAIFAWLIAPSLHAVSEGLALVASASKGGLALALRQVAITIFNLTVGAVGHYRRLLNDWGLLTYRGLLNDWRLDNRGRLDDWGLLGRESRCQ